MYYLLAGTLGFLLCGAWFGTQLWLKQLFSRWGREGLILFAPLLAACPPMLLLCWRGLYGPQGPALPQLWLWLLSGATVLAVCGIRCLGGRKGRTVGRRELARLCAEAAMVEVAQRGMLQVFLMALLEAWGCRAVWCVVLNGLVWCGGVLVQARLARQSMGRELAWELLSSLVFSLGCGYVFYRSGRLLFSAAAHAAERFLVTKLDR